MWSKLLILAVAVVLFAYWFRHNCLALLKTKSSRDYARQVAKANHLNFLEIQYRLQSDAEVDHFDSLIAALLSDYRLLSYLLRHTAVFHFGPESVHERMLMLYFRLVQFWYVVTHKLSRRQARRALEEMSQVLSHLANCMGERTALSGSGASRV